jgi:hypothetical protein
MYELNAQEIDMVAGAGLLDGLFGLFGSVVNNVVGSAATTILTPVVAVSNGVATVSNAANSSTGTGIIGGVGDILNAVVSGVGTGLSTGISTAGQITSGAAGATAVTSAINNATALNAFTAPFFNIITV